MYAPVPMLTTWMPVRSAGLGAAAPSAQVQSIAQAISVAEGYGVANAIPTMRNNPGNLKGANGQITSFATPADGWNALYAQVNLMITGQSAYYSPDMTWNQIAAIYAQGPDASNWANNVSAKLGVDPNSTLGDYLGGASTAPSYIPVDFSSTDASSTNGGGTQSDLASVTGIPDWAWITGGLALAVWAAS